MKRRIHNPWSGGRMTVDAFWIDGGRRHFDRLLIAQAMSEPLHLLTVDPLLPQYSELVILV